MEMLYKFLIALVTDFLCNSNVTHDLVIMLLKLSTKEQVFNNCDEKTVCSPNTNMLPQYVAKL